MDKKILIIGAGIAGLNAAKAARDSEPDCSITMLEAGEHNTYARTRLPEYISGKAKRTELFPYGDEWFEKYSISLVKGSRVTAVDTEAGTVTADTGVLEYDALIIAAGSSANIPSIPGADMENVFSVRTLEDSEKVIAAAEPDRICTIIGGGLLGLEMAWSVRQRGCRVNVIEHNPRLLPRQLDEQGASLLTDAIGRKGIKIYLSSDTQEIYGDRAAEYVVLKDGTELPTDFVILSTGVRANTGIFTGAGIAAGRALQIDEYMETNIKGIYAAGDVCEYNGRSYGIWPIAMAQGKIAGHNAAAPADGRIKYTELQPFTNLKIDGISMFSIGDISGEDCTIVSSLDRLQRKYLKFFLKNGRLKGAIAFGEPTLNMKIKKAVEQQKVVGHDSISITVNEIIENL